MNGTTVSALLLAVGFLMPASAGAATCSAADKRDMRNEGMSRTAIERICSSSAADDEDDDDAPAARRPARRAAGPAVSSRCVTPVLACFMGVTGPVGTPCWCATPFGPANGMVQ